MVKSRSIDFTYFSEKKDDSVIQIDIQHTSQIIINLLSNAIKYTPSGGAVHFTLKTESLPNGKVKHTYIISDNGIGMSKEFQETMFSAFTQESRSTAIQEKGTGLGLSIVKSLVDLMQGTIKVESDINKGSTFVVTIEYDKAKQTDIDKKEQGLAETSLYNLLNVRILLCEDNNVNAEIVTLQLQKRGIIVDRVSDGKSGVTKFEENPVNYYSTILMDVHMPIMGGLEATRVIRMMDREDAKKIPIVALTADAYDDDVKVCLNAGMNTHLAKPI